MPIHPMLLRQLKRLASGEDNPPTSTEQWSELLQRVSRAYTEADQERYLLSRSQEVASREIEEIYLRLSEAQRIAGLADWNFDIQHDVGQCSDGCALIFGTACTSLTPSYSSFIECFHPDDRGKLTSAINSALVHMDSFEMELRISPGNMDIRWVHVNVKPTPNPEGRAYQISGTAMDITERKKAEEGMKLTQFMMDNASINITLLDSDARICYANKTACDTLGYTKEELLKMYIPDIDPLFPSDVWADHWQDLKNNKSVPVETQHRRKNGEIFPVEVTANYIEFGGKGYNVAFDIDISARKGLENQLLQSQKMEAIGTLVGGIAHDFNNMLAGIMGNTYLAKKNATDTPNLLRNIGTIEELSNKAADMIRQMLTFARKDRVEMQSISAAPFLEKAVQFAKTAIPENIECICEAQVEHLNFIGDKTQLQQVIMNLMNNARDSLLNVKDGKITCSLKPYSADTAFKSKHPSCKEEDFACITVSDNGSGIKKELIENIFDPFFTTKEVGKGTGLGLAMVYGAIKNHLGEIEVESVSGRGTTFHIYLPLVSTVVASQEILSIQPKLIAGHSELVLVADDEAQVRDVIKAVLKKLGYRVMTAEDGIAAAMLHKKHSNQISLVILDVVMPKMGGVDAAKIIRKLTPNLPILFVTGYDREEVLNTHQEIANSLILNKPFQIPNLSQAIEELLTA